MRQAFFAQEYYMTQAWDSWQEHGHISAIVSQPFFIPDGELGGPTPEELVKLLDQYDISHSLNSTPCISPSPSIIGGSNCRGLPHQGLLGLTGSVPNLELVESEEGGAVGGQESSQVNIFCKRQIW